MAPTFVQVMTDNPYRLAPDIRGIGFKTADAIAVRLGIEKTAMIRVRAGISYALTEAMDSGPCGLPTDELAVLAVNLAGGGCRNRDRGYRRRQAVRIPRRPLPRRTGYCRAPAMSPELNGTLPWPHIDPEKALPWIEQKTGLALASQVAAYAATIHKSQGPVERTDAALSLTKWSNMSRPSGSAPPRPHRSYAASSGAKFSQAVGRAGRPEEGGRYRGAQCVRAAAMACGAAGAAARSAPTGSHRRCHTPPRSRRQSRGWSAATSRRSRSSTWPVARRSRIRATAARIAPMLTAFPICVTPAGFARLADLIRERRHLTQETAVLRSVQRDVQRIMLQVHGSGPWRSSQARHAAAPAS
jgi:hypothetical protein